MTQTPNSPQSDAERELVMTHLLDAPRELVFRMFTEARHLSQFWGPHGFTNPVCELDVRPGGLWRNVLRAPDGTEIPTTYVFREIVVPERIVYVNEGTQGPAPPSTNILTFEDQGGKTLLTIRTLFATAADRDATSAMGHVEGVNQSLDRMEVVLAMLRDEAGG